MVLSEVWETICAIYVYHILQCIVNKKKSNTSFVFRRQYVARYQVWIGPVFIYLKWSILYKAFT